MSNNDYRVCQSCGMPFESENSDKIAKEKDGSNSAYCVLCYKDGEFLAPDITINDIVEAGVPYLAQEFGEEEARKQLFAMIPKLARWSGDGAEPDTNAFSIGTQGLAPFLTFTGNAEEAMLFYVENLPGARIESLTRFKKGEPGDEGKVLSGILSFMDQQIMFMDMQAEYPSPDFSWSTSLFVNCKDEAEFDVVFAGLSKDGTVMMGPEAVMSIRKCAWVTDKFGVTWQPVWA